MYEDDQDARTLAAARKNRDFLDDLRQTLERNPQLVEGVLKVASEALVLYRNRVESHVAGDAEAGITAALGMPSILNDPELQRWDPQNRAHRSQARLLGVGKGLFRRERGFSPLDERLKEWVEAADLVDPEDAARHYRILDAQIPPHLEEHTKQH